MIMCCIRPDSRRVSSRPESFRQNRCAAVKYPGLRCAPWGSGVLWCLHRNEADGRRRDGLARTDRFRTPSRADQEHNTA
eukprot:2271366-Prymnesium_polylepis.1